MVGATIAVNRTLSGLAVLTPPPTGVPLRQPHNDGARMFTLVDSSGAVPRALISFDPYIHPTRPNMLLSSGAYAMPFQNLVVASCPAGAMFRIKIQ